MVPRRLSLRDMDPQINIAGTSSSTVCKEAFGRMQKMLSKPENTHAHTHVYIYIYGERERAGKGKKVLGQAIHRSIKASAPGFRTHKKEGEIQ